MPQNRQNHLDSLRGLAAMIVVVVHFLASFLPFAVYGDQPKSASHLPLIEPLFFYPPGGILVAGQLAVSLFFILSGYVLSWRYLGKPLGIIDTLAMTLKRPIRLGGLVWFSMLLYALFWYMGWFHNSEAAAITGSQLWLAQWWQGPLNVDLFWRDLFTASFMRGTVYNNPLWTIGYELYGSFLVFAFLLLFSGFKYRLVVVLILIGLFYDSMLVGFWLGVGLADVNKNHPDKLQAMNHPAWRWALLLVFLYLSSYPHYLPPNLLAQTSYAWLPSDFSFGMGYSMLASLIGFVLVLIWPRVQAGLNSRPLLFLGHISYAIYVMHVIVIGTLCSWLFVQVHPHLGYGWSVFMIFVLGISTAIVLSMAVTRFVDAYAIALAAWIGRKVKTLKQKAWLTKPTTWIESKILRQ